MGQGDNPATSGKDISLQAGSIVMYGLLGRCVIFATVERIVEGKCVSFFQLEPRKLGITRQDRKMSHIYVPVADAVRRGLRPLMPVESAKKCIQLLHSKEYYFDLDRPWAAQQAEFEQMICQGLPEELAKIVSYLHVARLRKMNLDQHFDRFQETLTRNLFRELAEVLGVSIKSLEEAAQKPFRAKLAAAH
jgi:RNA polymerase-interacting CarD/CdnL/TRCF family regulator